MTPSTTADTARPHRKRSTKEHDEKRDGESVDSRFEVELVYVGGGTR